ncbi:hypothetical protein PAPHI01_0248 [Pancytospora philotis]|nr:hypothetical protein PAPHI01_0248 [Pancytospora philotis]
MAAAEFLEYYRSVLGLTGADMQSFEASIDSPLPSTFRITDTADRAAVLSKLQSYSFLTRLEYLDDVYTFKLRDSAPDYADFIQFLVAQTSIGNIQRQEVVSMLPHLFLDLRPDSVVLETCASPGSKTKQLLEVVKEGLIVSNDKSAGRINVLISESFKKASSNFVVTMTDASRYPTCPLKFDRICCDVPCSSDGTVRKNRMVMDKWTVKQAEGLHPLQYRILERSLDNLRDGGILVYSTCSLNPIENECVINKILERGEHELVLDSTRLQHAPGDSTKVLVRHGIEEFNYGDYSYKNSALRKCIRVYPHDQNTGGFFIAVLRRKPSPDAPASEAKSEDAVRAQPESDRVGQSFYRVPDALATSFADSFPTSAAGQRHLVSLTRNFKNVFCLSDLAYSFIASQPKLKVPYAGIKAFTVTDIGDCAYRAKSAYMEEMCVTTDYTGTEADFKLLVENKTVPTDQLSFKARGHFSLGFEFVKYKFCGFSSANMAFLYIDAHHRKALSDIYLSGE